MAARRPSPRAVNVRSNDASMHWMSRVGVTGVIVCVLVMATLNALGWTHTLPGAPGIAAGFIAIGLEAVAFVAWEHIVAYRKARDWGRLGLAVIGLAFAVLVNIEGGHRGLNHILEPLWAEAEDGRRQVQAGLDAERGALADQIVALQARIDAIPAVNCALVGPDTCRSRTANWNDLTGDDRAALAAARAQLNALPLAAGAVSPYPAWGPYALTGVFAFFSLFGLTMFGAKVPGEGIGAVRPVRRREPAKPAPISAQKIVPINSEIAPPKPRRQIHLVEKAGIAAGVGLALLSGGQAAAAPISAQTGPTEASQQRGPATTADRERARALMGAGMSAKRAARETGVPYSTCKTWKPRATPAAAAPAMAPSKIVKHRRLA